MIAGSLVKRAQLSATTIWSSTCSALASFEQFGIPVFFGRHPRLQIARCRSDSAVGRVPRSVWAKAGMTAALRVVSGKPSGSDMPVRCPLRPCVWTKLEPFRLSSGPDELKWFQKLLCFWNRLIPPFFSLLDWTSRQSWLSH